MALFEPRMHERLLERASLEADLCGAIEREELLLHYQPVVHALKELGVRLAVDDFGTEFSSLAYLRRFPVDMLKIDRAFVQGVGGGPEDEALAHAIVRLGEALGLQTLAEGIETHGQADGLGGLGCTFVQGYWFARPMDAEAVGNMLGRGGVPRLPAGATGPPSSLARTVSGQRGR